MRHCQHSRHIFVKLVDDLPDDREVIRFGEDKLTLVEDTENGDCGPEAPQPSYSGFQRVLG
jgi:hypothetical protein